MAILVFGIGCGTSALAQQPVPAGPPATAPDPPKEPTSLKERIKEPDQGGGLHFTKHWAVAFGGIKQGSAIALGPAFSNAFESGAYVQLKAVYSLKQFRLLQARYDTQRFWNDRAVVISRVRWQDAPELSIYELGMSSPNARADYAERKAEFSSQLRARVRPPVTVAAGFGIERFSTREGDLVQAQQDALPAFPDVPGLATHPWFAHTFLGVAHDTRTSPDYSRSGHIVGAAFHDYRDVHGGQAAFELYDAAAQQLVPTFAQRGVLELGGRTWLTQADGPRAVPFYLMPTLGGGDYLRAFATYRFRDRNAWYVKAEYRWAVHTLADVAGFYEGGKVGPTLDALDVTDMAHSYGVGIRVHSKTANLFRADVAHGREGFAFRVGFNAGGS
jgi:hypothetical protein